MAKNNSNGSKGRDTVAEMKMYEMAATAAGMPKEWKPYGLMAIGEQYQGFGTDARDPIVNSALSEAQAALQAGQGYTADVANAIQLYAGKYEEAMQETTVGKFVDYVGYDMPDAVKDLVTQYSGKKISELDKNNDEQKKVLTALALLRNQKTTGDLVTNFVQNATARQTKQGLESLVQSGN